MSSFQNSRPQKAGRKSARVRTRYQHAQAQSSSSYPPGERLHHELSSVTRKRKSHTTIGHQDATGLVIQGTHELDSHDPKDPDGATPPLSGDSLRNPDFPISYTGRGTLKFESPIRVNAIDGDVHINGDVYTPDGKLSAGGGASDTIEATAPTATTSVYSNVTTGTVEVGGGITTSDGLVIGNSAAGPGTGNVVIHGDAKMGGNLVTDDNASRTVFADVGANDVSVGSATGTTTVPGDLVVEGDMTTSAGAKSVFTGMGANELTIGSSTGNVNVNNDLTVPGSITLNENIVSTAATPRSLFAGIGANQVQVGSSTGSVLIPGSGNVTGKLTANGDIDVGSTGVGSNTIKLFTGTGSDGFYLETNNPGLGYPAVRTENGENLVIWGSGDSEFRSTSGNISLNPLTKTQAVQIHTGQTSGDVVIGNASATTGKVQVQSVLHADDGITFDGGSTVHTSIPDVTTATDFASAVATNATVTLGSSVLTGTVEIGRGATSGTVEIGAGSGDVDLYGTVRVKDGQLQSDPGQTLVISDSTTDGKVELPRQVDFEIGDPANVVIGANITTKTMQICPVISSGSLLIGHNTITTGDIVMRASSTARIAMWRNNAANGYIGFQSTRAYMNAGPSGDVAIGGTTGDNGFTTTGDINIGQGLTSGSVLIGNPTAASGRTGNITLVTDDGLLRLQSRGGDIQIGLSGGTGDVDVVRPMHLLEGLSFDSGTNTMDFYESGEFTPTLEDSSGNSFTMTTANSGASYVRIGDLVHVSIRVAWNSKGSAVAGDRVTIHAMPFAAGSRTNLVEWGFILNNFDGLNILSATSIPGFTLDEGATVLNGRKTGYGSPGSASNFLVSELDSSGFMVVSGSYHV